MIADRLKNINKSIIRQIFDSAPPNAINMGLGEIQFNTPNIVKLKAKKAINQNEIYYTPNAGLTELREAVANYYNKQNMQSISFKNTCIFNGAQEAIFSVLFSILNPDDELIITDPTFLAYKTIAAMFGASTKTFPLDSSKAFSFDIKQLEEQITQKTKAVFLNHPANPTGKAFSEKDIKEISNLCKKHNIILIADEVYIELYLKKPIPSFWGHYDNTVIISGLSKSHCMTGWRIGWVVAKEELLEKFIVAHQYISTCVSPITQKAAIAALSEKGMETIKSLRKRLIKNYNIATQYLKNHITYEAEVAPYLMIKIKDDDITFCKQLAQKGLIVMPGSAFGKESQGYIRINYALNEKKLRMGLKILLKNLT